MQTDKWRTFSVLLHYYSLYVRITYIQRTTHAGTVDVTKKSTGGKKQEQQQQQMYREKK